MVVADDLEEAAGVPLAVDAVAVASEDVVARGEGLEGYGCGGMGGEVGVVEEVVEFVVVVGVGVIVVVTVVVVVAMVVVVTVIAFARKVVTFSLP